MDYCACGHQATGRCTRNGEFFCNVHKRTYPRSVADLLEQANHGPLTLSRSSGPPLKVQVRGGAWTLLCPSCYQDAIDDVLPEISTYLTSVESASVERIVIRLLRSAGTWRDSVNGYHPVGPDIITAVAGHKPEWLYDNEVQTAGALYADVARARSLSPPHIEVVHVHEKRTHSGWRNKEKVTRTARSLGALDAWAFHIHDEWNWVLLVGADGGVAKVSSSWLPVNNTITLSHVGDVDWSVDDGYVLAARRELARGPDPTQILDESGCGPLLHALEQILPRA